MDKERSREKMNGQDRDQDQDLDNDFYGYVFDSCLFNTPSGNSLPYSTISGSSLPCSSVSGNSLPSSSASDSGLSRSSAHGNSLPVTEHSGNCVPIRTPLTHTDGSTRQLNEDSVGRTECPNGPSVTTAVDLLDPINKPPQLPGSRQRKTRRKRNQDEAFGNRSDLNLRRSLRSKRKKNSDEYEYY